MTETIAAEELFPVEVRFVSGTEYLRLGAGTPIALAHGAGGDVGMNFDPMMKAYADHHALVGIRYPGTGGTDPDGNLDPFALADRLLEVMEVEGHQRFPIVGVSFGCAVAMAEAISRPDRVSALVLTVGFGAADIQLRTVISTWAALRELPDKRRLGAYLLTQLSNSSTLSDLTDAQFETMAHAVGAQLPAGAYAQMVAAGTVDLRDRLAEITVPTLVVVAGQDRVVLPSTTHRLAAAIGGARVVEYPTAGHSFTEEVADMWLKDVTAFLDPPVGGSV